MTIHCALNWTIKPLGVGLIVATLSGCVTKPIEKPCVPCNPPPNEATLQCTDHKAGYLRTCSYLAKANGVYRFTAAVRVRTHGAGDKPKSVTAFVHHRVAGTGPNESCEPLGESPANLAGQTAATLSLMCTVSLEARKQYEFNLSLEVIGRPLDNFQWEDAIVTPVGMPSN